VQPPAADDVALLLCRSDVTFFICGACCMGRSQGQTSLHDMLLSTTTLHLQRMPRLTQFVTRGEVPEWNMRAISGPHAVRHYKEDYRFFGFPYLHRGSALW
jgi:hypothetical protein